MCCWYYVDECDYVCDGGGGSGFVWFGGFFVGCVGFWSVDCCCGFGFVVYWLLFGDLYYNCYYWCVDNVCSFGVDGCGYKCGDVVVVFVVDLCSGLLCGVGIVLVVGWYLIVGVFVCY